MKGIWNSVDYSESLYCGCVDICVGVVLRTVSTYATNNTLTLNAFLCSSAAFYKWDFLFVYVSTSPAGLRLRLLSRSALYLENFYCAKCSCAPLPYAQDFFGQRARCRTVRGPGERGNGIAPDRDILPHTPPKGPSRSLEPNSLLSLLVFLFDLLLQSWLPRMTPFGLLAYVSRFSPQHPFLHHSVTRRRSAWNSSYKCLAHAGLPFCYNAT